MPILLWNFCSSCIFSCHFSTGKVMPSLRRNPRRRRPPISCPVCYTIWSKLRVTWPSKSSRPKSPPLWALAPTRCWRSTMKRCHRAFWMTNLPWKLVAFIISFGSSTASWPIIKPTALCHGKPPWSRWRGPPRWCSWNRSAASAGHICAGSPRRMGSIPQCKNSRRLSAIQCADFSIFLAFWGGPMARIRVTVKPRSSSSNHSSIIRHHHHHFWFRRNCNRSAIISGVWCRGSGKSGRSWWKGIGRWWNVRLGRVRSELKGTKCRDYRRLPDTFMISSLSVCKIMSEKWPISTQSAKKCLKNKKIWHEDHFTIK